MNEFNEKDQLSGSESTGNEAESQPVEAQDTGYRADAPAADEAPKPDTGYWSSTGQGPSDTPGQSQEPAQPNQSGGYQQGTGYGQGGYYNRGYGSTPPPQQNTPYTPPYQNNNYPPNNQNTYNQNRNYGGQGYQQGYNQPPYQYNPNSGWQQPPTPQQDKYEWKFEDYDKLDGKKEKGTKKRNRGLVVFTVSLLCMMSIGLVGLAGYSIYTAYMDEPVAEEGGEAESSMEEGADAVSPASELEIATKPEISESLPVGGKMTIPQVAQAVLPSVVGVIKYDNDQYYEIGGLGSGIVMTTDGYIITNAHVVAEGTGFKVQLHNGDPYDAELIGSDALTDLAVLKIDATDLVPAQFGDSAEIEVGETVVAIGNPAGLELAGSVTQGIVSAVNREVRTTNSMTYIQTDAAINPGNSGGALANEYGQVIGINSNKIVAAGYEGIGFAIPISEAKPVIDDLITNGRVTGRTMLGITARTVDEVDARNYGVMMGLSIETIDPESDLINSDVQKGDILTHIDGERIYTLNDVRKVLDVKKPGDTVTLSLYRRIGNQEHNFDAETRLMESK